MSDQTATQFSDLPAGAQVVSVPQSQEDHNFSDLPAGAQVVSAPSADEQSAQSNVQALTNHIAQLDAQKMDSEPAKSSLVDAQQKLAQLQGVDVHQPNWISKLRVSANPAAKLDSSTGIAAPLDAIAQGVGSVSTGAGKGAAKTLNTVAGVANRAGLVSDQSLQNFKAKGGDLTPQGFLEHVGYDLEGLSEWMLASELGAAGVKQLSAVEKYKSLGNAAKWLMDNPVKARLMGNAMMAGTSTAATTAAQGGSAKDIAEEGTTGAALGAGAGLLGEGAGAVVSKAASGVGNLMERMGVSGDIIDFVKKAANETPVRTPQEQSAALTTSLDAEESAMHDRFDAALNNVRGSLSGKVVKASDMPLYGVAQKLKNQDASLSPELLEGLRSLTPNAGKVDKILDDVLANPDAGFTGDSLISLRRGLNSRIKSADPILKPAISELMDGIDLTLDKLDAGASTKYAAARTDYKTTLAALKDSAVKAIRSGRQNDVTDYLTMGGGSVAKINALKTALGDDGPSNVALLGAEKFAKTAQDSLDDAGNVDLNKFVSGWRKIPQQTREAMFSGVSGGNAFLGKLNDVVDQAKAHAKVVKSIKIILPAAGAALTGLGLTSDKKTWGTLETMLGLATAVGGYAGAKPLVDLLASSPALLRAMGGAASIPLAAQGVQPLVSHGAAAGITHYYDAAKNALVSTKDYLLGQ